MANDILQFQAGREAAIDGAKRDGRRSADWLEGYDQAKPAAFNPELVKLTRIRFSTTQGEVLVEYDGRRIEQYGDAIALRDGEWKGYSDEFLINVARREAIERGLAS